MSDARMDPTEALDAFVAATRRLAELARASEPDQLDAAVEDQVARFVALEDMLSQGAQPQASRLAEAIDEAGRTLLDVSQRRDEVRKALGDLRNSRNRTRRRLGFDDAAQFVSRRV